MVKPDSAKEMEYHMEYLLPRGLPRAPKQPVLITQLELKEKSSIKNRYLEIPQRNLRSTVPEVNHQQALSDTSGKNLSGNGVNKYFRPLPRIPIQPLSKQQKHQKHLSGHSFQSPVIHLPSKQRSMLKVNSKKDNKAYTADLDLDMYKKSMLFINGVNCQICTCPAHSSYNPSKCSVCPC